MGLQYTFYVGVCELVWNMKWGGAVFAVCVVRSVRLDSFGLLAIGGRHVDLTAGSYVGRARWTRLPNGDWQVNAPATINKEIL